MTNNKKCENCENLQKSIEDLQNELTICLQSEGINKTHFKKIKEKKRRFFRKIGQKTNNIIKGFFYVFIIVSVLYASLYFVLDISHIYKSKVIDISPSEVTNNICTSIKKDSTNFTENQIEIIKRNINKEIIEKSDSIAIERSNTKDIQSLEIIEHIFIYLIPLLVFLGLYFYYKINFEDQFVGIGSQTKEYIQRTKDSLQLTKTLFLSSIMSYMIIKVIEKVILVDEKTELDNIKLIAYGIFITLIMVYLLISHIVDSKADNKEDKKSDNEN